jgi:hypothetical protein
MNPMYALPTPRLRPRHGLLTRLTLAVGALIISAVLFTAMLYANADLIGRHWIPLSRGQSLGIGVFPGCPVAMPEMACLHIERRFPPAFRVVYRSTGKNMALVSIPLPRR